MLSEKYSQALVLAKSLHDGQFRKSTTIPYFSHLIAVSGFVLEAGDVLKRFNIEEAAIAALLNDSLEDQGHKITLDEIETKFGPLVSSIVAECSDAIVTTEGGEKPAWRVRKEAYIAAIAGKRRETLLVTSADKLHNMRCIIDDHHSIGPKIWDRFTANRDDINWYFKDLVHEIGTTWPENPLNGRLDRALDELAVLE